jgi:hypothetical protein
MVIRLSSTPAVPRARGVAAYEQEALNKCLEEQDRKQRNAAA